MNEYYKKVCAKLLKSGCTKPSEAEVEIFFNDGHSVEHTAQAFAELQGKAQSSRVEDLPFVESK